MILGNFMVKIKIYIYIYIIMVKGCSKKKTLKKGKKNYIKIKGGNEHDMRVLKTTENENKNTILGFIKDVKQGLEYSYDFAHDTMDIDIARRYISLQTTKFNNEFHSFTKLYLEKLENKRKKQIVKLIEKRTSFNKKINLYNILHYIFRKITNDNDNENFNKFYIKPTVLMKLSEYVSDNIYDILEKDMKKMKPTKKFDENKLLGFDGSDNLKQRLTNEAAALFEICSSFNFNNSDDDAIDYFTKVDFLGEISSDYLTEDVTIEKIKEKERELNEKLISKNSILRDNKNEIKRTDTMQELMKLDKKCIDLEKTIMNMKKKFTIQNIIEKTSAAAAADGRYTNTQGIPSSESRFYKHYSNMIDTYSTGIEGMKLVDDIKQKLRDTPNINLLEFKGEIYKKMLARSPTFIQSTYKRRSEDIYKLYKLNQFFRDIKVIGGSCSTYNTSDNFGKLPGDIIKNNTYSVYGFHSGINNNKGCYFTLPLRFEYEGEDILKLYGDGTPPSSRTSAFNIQNDKFVPMMSVRKKTTGIGRTRVLKRDLNRESRIEMGGGANNNNYLAKDDGWRKNKTRSARWRRRLKRDAASGLVNAYSGTSKFLGNRITRVAATSGRAKRALMKKLGNNLSKSSTLRKVGSTVGYVSKFGEKQLRTASGMLDEDIKNKRERVFDSCVINIFVTGDLVYVKSRSENNINKWIYSAAYVVDGTHPYYNVKYIRTGWQRPEKFIVKGIKYENLYWLGWARDRFISAKTMKIGMRMARITAAGGIIPFLGPMFDGAIEGMVESAVNAMDAIEDPELLPGIKLDIKTMTPIKDSNLGEALVDNSRKESDEGELARDRRDIEGQSAKEFWTHGANKRETDPANYLSGPNGEEYVIPKGVEGPDGVARLSPEQYSDGKVSVYKNPEYTADLGNDWDDGQWQTYLNSKNPGSNPPMSKQIVPKEYHNGNEDVPLWQADMTEEQFVKWYGRTEHIQVDRDANGDPTGTYSYINGENVSESGKDMRYVYRTTDNGEVRLKVVSGNELGPNQTLGKPSGTYNAANQPEYFVVNNNVENELNPLQKSVIESNISEQERLLKGVEKMKNDNLNMMERQRMDAINRNASIGMMGLAIAADRQEIDKPQKPTDYKPQKPTDYNVTGGGDASEGGKTKEDIYIYPYIPIMPLRDEDDDELD